MYWGRVVTTENKAQLERCLALEENDGFGVRRTLRFTVFLERRHWNWLGHQGGPVSGPIRRHPRAPSQEPSRATADAENDEVLPFSGALLFAGF